MAEKWANAKGRGGNILGRSKQKVEIGGKWMEGGRGTLALWGKGCGGLLPRDIDGPFTIIGPIKRCEVGGGRIGEIMG